MTKLPVDVSTNGSASGHVPQPAAAVAEDWRQNPWVQLYRGVVAGIPLGIVPYAATGQQLLDAAKVLPERRRSPSTRRGSGRARGGGGGRGASRT